MELEGLLSRPDIFQYRIAETSVIPFSKAVADACKRNACGKYGTCWTCPPGVGEYTALEKKIKSYEKAAVFSCTYDLADSFDFDGMMQGMQSTMQILYGITDTLRRSGEAFMALGCEGCGLCQTCTYPDAPCRFPEKATVSVEACGIDVVTLAKRLGINYGNGANTVTYFCVILF